MWYEVCFSKWLPPWLCIYLHWITPAILLLSHLRCFCGSLHLAFAHTASNDFISSAGFTTTLLALFARLFTNISNCTCVTWLVLAQRLLHSLNWGGRSNWSDIWKNVTSTRECPITNCSLWTKPVNLHCAVLDTGDLNSSPTPVYLFFWIVVTHCRLLFSVLKLSWKFPVHPQLLASLLQLFPKSQ